MHEVEALLREYDRARAYTDDLPLTGKTTFPTARESLVLTTSSADHPIPGGAGEGCSAGSKTQACRPKRAGSTVWASASPGTGGRAAIAPALRYASSTASNQVAQDATSTACRRSSAPIARASSCKRQAACRTTGDSTQRPAMRGRDRSGAVTRN